MPHRLLAPEEMIELVIEVYRQGAPDRWHALGRTLRRWTNKEEHWPEGRQRPRDWPPKRRWYDRLDTPPLQERVVRFPILEEDDLQKS